MANPTKQQLQFIVDQQTAALLMIKELITPLTEGDWLAMEPDAAANVAQVIVNLVDEYTAGIDNAESGQKG